jgi:RHS repeat-associated protein
VTNPYRLQTVSPFGAAESVYRTESVFDTAGRPWKTITADNAVVETTYGIVGTGGNIGTWVTVKDQAGKLRRSVTNALGQLTRVDEPNNAGELGAVDAPYQPTYYTYDLLNNLEEVQQPGDNNEECGPSTTNCSQTRSFQYDSLSRLKQATNPESGTIQYTYDANGNLATKTDAHGILTTFAYDALNRIKMRTYTNEPAGSETPDVSYYYDLVPNAKGKLIKITNGTGANLSTTEYVSFDALGRVTRSIQTTDGITYGGGIDQTKWMTYTYNLSGALTEQQYPSGRVVKNVLDSDGELATVQSKKNSNYAFWNFANHFLHNAAGAVTSMQLGNGRWESIQFNSRLQPTQIALGKTAPYLTAQGQPVYSSELLKLNYEYGALDLGTGQTIAGTNNGNVSKQTITVQAVGATPGFEATQYYSYDSLNRIEIATENILPDGQPLELGWRQHFKFDRYGNRNFVTTGATATTTLGTCPTEECNPSISPNTNKITSTGYSFDAAGNTTRDAQDRKFTYDADNKQTKVETLSGQTVTGTVGEYWYDGDGRRIKKRAYDNNVPTEETIFVYDAAGKLIGEYSNQVASSQDAEVAYLTSDHLGSPRIHTDINGNVSARHDYYPFGEEVSNSRRTAGIGYDDDTVRKQFTGYERDGESDLHFAQARFFSGGLGRFTTPDEPLLDQSEEDAQSWNLYQYVRNNPLNLIDPSGQAAACPQGGCPKECPDGKSCTLDKDGNIVDMEDAPPIQIQTKEKRKENPILMFLRGFRRVAEPWQPYVEAVTPAAGPGGAVIKGGMWVFRGGKWLFTALKLGNGGRRALPVLQRLCFVAGTPILTRTGLKPIEEIRAGDEVLSYNEKTKQNEFKTVVQTMERFAEPGRILSIKVEGEVAPLGVTAEHPFYVRAHHARDDTFSEDDDGEWVEAGELRSGDEVRRADGSWAKVESVVGATGGAQVHNFEVADNHNYFVGGTHLLTHNNNCLPAVQKAVNSNLPHAAQRAIERGFSGGADEAANALRQLSREITENGFPSGTISDTAKANRVLVPFKDGLYAVYQVGANGTAKLKTVLIAK